MNITQTAIDFSPLLLDVLSFLGILLVGVAAWATKKYISSHLDAQAAQMLDTAIRNGINYAINTSTTYVKGLNLTVDSHSAIVATAANYAITHTPDALQRLGVTEQQLADKIIARLPQ